jgi:hypothetical protein
LSAENIFVTDGKSDAESDRHPICMQIAERFGFRIIRVDGPLDVNKIRYERAMDQEEEEEEEEEDGEEEVSNIFNSP